MYVEDFSGRGASVKGLCNAFLSGAPAHATLLAGPVGVGKRTLASLLAQSLFCAGGGPKPCGICPPCRRFLAGSHPDAHRIPAQKRIGVDDIRALLAGLHAAPYEGGWRTVILEDAGTMTPQAQNSLLKTLEEPPQRTVFLLTAISAAQLLPTVRSRCRIVQAPPMADEAVRQALLARGLDEARAAQLAPLSRGSVGEALRMDTDEGFWALRRRLYGALDGVRGPADVLPALNLLKDDKAEAALCCDLLEHALRDALFATLRGASPSAESGWPQTLRRAGPKSLLRLLEQIAQTRRMLGSNVSWQAALERFLLEYAEESKLWQS